MSSNNINQRLAPSSREGDQPPRSSASSGRTMAPPDESDEKHDRSEEYEKRGGQSVEHHPRGKAGVSPSEDDQVEEIHEASPGRGTSGAPLSMASPKGRWGELVPGSGVEINKAMEEFTELRRTLTTMSEATKTDALGFPLDEGDDLGKGWKHASMIEGGVETPEEGGEGSGTRRGKLNLQKWISTRNKVYQEAGIPVEKALGVFWQNLTVKGIDSRQQFVRTLPIATLDTFGPQAFRFVLSKFPYLSRFLPPSLRVPVRTLIEDFNGSLKDGEMCLVLGRPGSGCSTFLKAVSNEHDEFVSVDGNLCFDGLSSEKVKRSFRGETVYNAEEDEHFPTLTVWQTIRFAVQMKIPFHRPPGESRSAYTRLIVRTFLKMFGIEHTADTLVGNAMVRGVSGGERKRVSIAEALATGGAVSTWDNSTRGLDSATAVDYIRSLRVLADLAHRTILVSLYQASESIYELFDKVLLIDEGRMVFFGPAKEAREYFESLGFRGPPRQTTPDFLTAITDPAENLVVPGYDSIAPLTPADRERAFRNSPYWEQLQSDMADLKAMGDRGELEKRAEQFKEVVRGSKTPLTPKGESWTVSIFSQTKALVKRQFLLKWGARHSLYVKTFTNFFVSLVVGSMFYGNGKEADHPTTNGAFSRGSGLFFSVIFMGWLELSEIFEAVSGRAIITRHKNFAFYRPGAVSLARVVVDAPILLMQAIIWSLGFYFMAQLERSASAFFIYMLFVYTSAFSLSAFFRAVASLSPEFDTAIRFAVIALNIMITMAGYAIPRAAIPAWFRWIFYVQPLTWAFQGAMADQFRRITMQCATESIVPRGPGISPEFQTCAFPGGQSGSLVVTGSDYVEAAFGFSTSVVWRDWGIVVAYTIVYIIATVIFSEFIHFSGSAGGGGLVFKRGSKTVLSKRTPSDAEAQVNEKGAPVSGFSSGAREARIEATKSIFTFKDISYDAITADGPKRLLRNVSGIIRPGETTALMGMSGAGKTTLLTTLSQRMDPSLVSGEMLVDGRPLDATFQKMTGFAEQSDIHEETATVLEALEFSAVLRQPSSIPREEKLAYARDVLRLLELEPIADVLILSLSVEQKKRVTIGVELAARPTLLTFFDEPTSGLDSNGAMSIGRLIRKLADNGQSCIATIHQPSSRLVSDTFDRILLIGGGGKTCYNGPVGDVTRYFESKGARLCGPDENVAEYILEIASLPTPKDSPHSSWGDIWNHSVEHEQLLAEIDKVNEAARQRPVPPQMIADTGYSATLLEQTREVIIRIGKSFYRDPSYGYGKLATAFVTAIFVGFTFWKLNHSVAALQQGMFVHFLIILIVPAVANASIPRHFGIKGIWFARERHTRTYSWAPLVTGILVNELPFALLMTILYWPTFYWPVGFSTGEAAGYTFLGVFLVNLFVPSWIHWLCAIFPDPGMVMNMLPFGLVILNLMNGIVVPWARFPAPWKWFLYYANPMTYYLRGSVAATLRDRLVVCKPDEFYHFNVPSNTSCQAYAGNFVTEFGGQLFQESDGSCSFCQYADGNQYLKTLNADPDFRWQDLGIFGGFVVSNFILCYGLFYLFQIKNAGSVPARVISGLMNRIKRN